MRIKRDPETGKLMEEDPFMADFPELLDVGIMGHCIHGKSGLCRKAGIECYQSGFTRNEPNMTLEDFKMLAEECDGKTYQFALGGCGDPDEHENFKEILQVSREHHIVPNFTTSGLGMNKERAEICKEYCGAVAVSWYRSEYTIQAIEILSRCGVKTNIHYVLSKSTIDEAISRLKNHDFPKEVNAVIFLLHKPVGQGKLDEVLSIGDGNVEENKVCELLSLVEKDREKFPWRIGFDSCIVPALLNFGHHFPIESFDFCEGARWGAYVSPDMKIYPCSFANQMEEWAYDLRGKSIQEAWNSSLFEKFRNHFRTSCTKICGEETRRFCMGGCPIVPEIVICPKRNWN